MLIAPRISSSERTVVYLTAQLDPLWSSLQPDGMVTSEAGADVISTGDSKVANADTSATILSSLSTKITIHNKGCIDRSQEILIIVVSIIRNVELPGAITCWLSGGKAADFTELTPPFAMYFCIQELMMSCLDNP